MKKYGPMAKAMKTITTNGMAPVNTTCWKLYFLRPLSKLSI
ncbi:MAG: hypothetical protein ABSA11_05175 [Candidatus Bathyarchaeia archaeon]